jgi:transposase
MRRLAARGRRPASEDSEVERLKRELARVTEARDMLKKAAAYFAKHLG